MSDLTDFERELLRGMADADAPNPEDRARVRNRVLARISAVGVGVGAAAALSGSTSAAATTGGTTTAAVSGGGAVASGVVSNGLLGSLGIKVLAAVALGGVVWGASELLVSAKSEPTHAQPVAHEPNATGTMSSPKAAAAPETRVEAPGVAATAALPPFAPLPARAVARAAPPKVEPAPSDLGAEMKLLSEAQAAAQAGDSQAALKALRAHGAAHPDGVLSQERRAITAVALCGSENAAERQQGVQLARQFLATQGGSPLSARVSKACLE